MNNENTSADLSDRPQDAHTQTPFADDEWMTVDQVAEHFGVPATRVREWIDSGILTTRASGSIELIQRGELSRVGNPDEAGANEFKSDHGDGAA